MLIDACQQLIVFQSIIPSPPPHKLTALVLPIKEDLAAPNFSNTQNDK